MANVRSRSGSGAADRVLLVGMARLNMQSSTDITNAILHALRREAGVDDLKFRGDPERVLGGNETTIFRFALDVPDDHGFAGALIARIYFETRNPLQHRIEAQVHSTLRARGYPVPAVRFVSDGDGLGAPWILMDKLPGAMLGSEALEMPWGIVRFRDALHAVPRKLAELHLQLHGVSPEVLEEELAALVGEAAPFTPAGQIRNARRWIGEAADMSEALQIMEEKLPPTRRAVVCHGDFHPLNVLGDVEHGHGVIDWGKICFADREFDVGSTLAILELTSLNLPPVIRRIGEWVKFKMGARYIDAYARGGHALDSAEIRYYYTLRALLELIYARSHAVPELGDIGGWNMPRLLEVVREFTGVRIGAS
jgi:aminoglycoside phosphotransferase (APT) family kinase protein